MDTKLEEMKKELGLLNVQEVSEITGWAPNTVRKAMEDKECNTIKIGKENQITFEGLKNYLSKRRTLRGDN